MSHTKKVIQLKSACLSQDAAEDTLAGFCVMPQCLIAYAIGNEVIALFDTDIPDNMSLPQKQRVALIPNDEYNRLKKLKSTASK
jgi:hypothetical protein